MSDSGTERQSGFYDEASETMSLDARRAMQDGIARGVAQLCFDGSSTFREKMQLAGIEPADVTSLEALARIPVTHKHETQDVKFEGVMVVPYRQARRIFVSPGPQFYAYGPIPQEANPLLKVYHAVGFRKGDIVLNTFEYHLSPAGINFDESLGAFGCAVIPAGPHNGDLQIQVLEKIDVTAYVGTPSFLKILLSKARDAGLDPRSDFSLEAALTSAEPLDEPLRAELEEGFDATVRQLYGSADGLLPCFECWAADGMHVPELMILEITDPETGVPLPDGQAGAVTATVPNPYRPLLRFANGDRAVMTNEPCRCGRTGPRIFFAGRIDAAAKVRGMFVYPEQIGEVVGRCPAVSAWRAIVGRDARGLDTFTVEIEGGGSGDASRIAEGIRSLIRLRADVVAVPDGAIDAGAASTLEDRR